MAGSSALRVDEPEGSRWQAALQVLADGGYVVCMGLGLTFQRQTSGSAGEPLTDGPLHVIVESEWEPPNLTSDKAESQLLNAIAGIDDLRARSEEFDGLIAGHPIDYTLIHTYGMGAVHLASIGENGFEYVWPSRGR